MSKQETPQRLAPSATHKAGDPPLQLIVFSPEGEPDSPQQKPPFKLCHGARHQLKITAPPGSLWKEQRLCVLWMDNNEGASTLYGLSATPPLKDDDQDNSSDKEHHYLTLSGGVAQWGLEADKRDDARSGLVKLGLGSYWQAPKYLFEADVGDHWFSITDLEWDGTTPIVGGKAVTLTVTVNSAFVEKRAMPGVEVEWTVGVQAPQRIVTDTNGQSKFEYIPKEEDIEGEYITITAACKDALGHDISIEKKLRAFVKAPWDELMTLVLREKDGPVVDPSELGMRLARGGKYELTLTPESADDYFIGHMITLGWFDNSLLRNAKPQDEKQLGIDFCPTIEREMTKDGLTWEINAGEDSGEFKLQVWSDRLGKEVPFLLPGVQMSANLAEEAELKVMLDEAEMEESPPIFHRGVNATVRIIPFEHSPLRLMKLTAKLQFDQIEGEFSQGQVPSDPAYGVESEEVTDAGVQWCLNPKDSGNSGQFGLKIEMPGFTTPLMLEKVLALSKELGDETQVFINDDKDPLGGRSLVLRRGTPLAIKLKPRDHSGLGRTKLKGWITFDGGDLSPGQVVAKPGYGIKKDMTEEGLSWTLTGENVSGSLRLTIHVERFEAMTTLPNGVLLSQHLIDEVTVMVDGEMESDPLIFPLDKGRKIRVEPSSPLASLSEKCKLGFKAESLTDPSQVPASPPYEEERALTASGLEWEVKGAAPGTFGLDIHMPGFVTTVSRAARAQSKLTDHAHILIDLWSWPESPMILDRGKEHTIRIIPKPDSAPLFEGPASMHFKEGGLPKEIVKAEPDYNVERCVPEEGLTWKIRGDESMSGLFGLELHVAGFENFSMDNIILASIIFDDELQLRANDAPFKRLILQTGVKTKLTIEPKPGSPLRHAKISAQLDVPADIARRIDETPRFGNWVTLGDGADWWLTGLYPIEPGFYFRIRILSMVGVFVYSVLLASAIRD
ncbi:hypothetical protein P5705_12165 [Pseudomonas entomophila]|uniref:hypothetical protein n=1 Tax=Pseudomonas entomophila TaxID=312306 RepID=UPI002404EB28|nr:hypothetical protein [Pseudomonas entomophila]MDF9618403.1 hypothetical protein [Pseudomonas entomophila]